jgi:spore maturation protein CgeB
MNILVVAVFSTSSTNNSQARGFKHLGHNVKRYNYRKRAKQIGKAARDQEIIDLCREYKSDLVFFSKCNEVSVRVIQECSKMAKTCLWYMDPLNANYNAELRQKIKFSTFSCFDKVNVLKKALKINSNCYHVVEGYDHLIDKPHDLPKIHDSSFIGNMRENRRHYQKILGFYHTNNAYGADMAKVVSQSKINLNFTTASGASDRVYKVMGAGGFLLTEDWTGRKDLFEDGKHLVVFAGDQDAKQKIKYYLDHEDERRAIAEAGQREVQHYSRYAFAKKIVEIGEKY